MTTRNAWYIIASDKTQPGVFGIGECAPIENLSREHEVDMDAALTSLCEPASRDHFLQSAILNFPSIHMGFETALLDLNGGGTGIIFPSAFIKGEEQIKINGLIWMASKKEMIMEAEEKIAAGFQCIKMKIGSIDWKDELEILQTIRSMGGNEIQLRVDANGAFEKIEGTNFKWQNVITKLESLSRFNLHSIEQPVFDLDALTELCKLNIIPIALDESLIEPTTASAKEKLLDAVNPHYIVLKPTLIGGFQRSEEWIRLANARNIGWWITSALESNIGLSAIAQWASILGSHEFQGLGTGKLFTNNIPTSLYVKDGKLGFDPEQKIDTSAILLA
ncbi:MAG: o-succinylbenzoate synthase [Flavobacteriales bacterium]|nr:o-succinylbenzoate synthase [Flavobacteriales bacterium]